MAELLQVVAGERGTLRIFSVEMEAAERRKVLAPKPDTAPTGAALGALLGVDWIDPDHADLFDVAELDDLGRDALDCLCPWVFRGKRQY